MSRTATFHFDPVARRQRRFALVLRVLWYVAAVLAIQAFLLSIPLGYERLMTVCMEELCYADQLRPAGVEALQALGLSVQFYAIYELFINTLAMLIFGGTAVIIFYSRPNEPMALFVAITLMLFGVFVPENIDTLGMLHPNMPWFVDLMRSICWTSFVLLYYLFPDGKFTPRWTRWAALVWVLMQLVPLIVGRGGLDWGLVAGLIELFAYVALLVLCIVAQVIRYRRSANDTQRQQTKWVLFGFIQAVLTVIFFVELTILIFPAAEVAGSLPNLAVSMIQLVSLSLVPISIGFAIMRFRLWEIDLIINRTLVYIPLTSILAVLYATTLSVSQRVFTTATGEQSQGVAVITTIVLTTTFTPIRTRLQSFVDRHFKEPPDRMKDLRQLEEQVRYVVETLDRQEVGRRLVAYATFALDAQSGALYVGQGAEQKLVHASEKWNPEESQLSLILTADEETYGQLLLHIPDGNIQPEHAACVAVSETAARVLKRICRVAVGVS
jgi:hypothetical protein